MKSSGFHSKHYKYYINLFIKFYNTFWTSTDVFQSVLIWTSTDVFQSVLIWTSTDVFQSVLICSTTHLFGFSIIKIETSTKTFNSSFRYLVQHFVIQWRRSARNTSNSMSQGIFTLRLQVTRAPFCGFAQVFLDCWYEDTHCLESSY